MFAAPPRDFYTIAGTPDFAPGSAIDPASVLVLNDKMKPDGTLHTDVHRYNELGTSCGWGSTKAVPRQFRCWEGTKWWDGTKSHAGQEPASLRLGSF